MTGGNFPLPQIKDDSMNNLLARFFKKKTLEANLPQVSTVVMFDPMVPCPKIPVVEKPYIITQICETGKMGNHPDYKK